MAERGRLWTDPEIAILLEVWSEESIQRQLKGVQRGPYKKIVDALEESYKRSMTTSERAA